MLATGLEDPGRLELPLQARFQSQGRQLESKVQRRVNKQLLPLCCFLSRSAHSLTGDLLSLPQSLTKSFQMEPGRAAGLHGLGAEAGTDWEEARSWISSEEETSGGIRAEEEQTLR